MKSKTKSAKTTNNQPAKLAYASYEEFAAANPVEPIHYAQVLADHCKNGLYPVTITLNLFDHELMMLAKLARATKKTPSQIIQEEITEGPDDYINERLSKRLESLKLA